MNSNCYSRTERWTSVIQKTYSHPVYRIISSDGNEKGLIDIVQIKSLLFGHSLVSMPFSDLGGFYLNNNRVEKELFNKAIIVMKKCKADSLEIRLDRPLEWLNYEYMKQYSYECKGLKRDFEIELMTHKVRMILDLPGTVDELYSRFKSKLKSQIKRPLKDEMRYKVGKHELIPDFYHVFSCNMRDLGSPVHSIKLFYHVLNEFFEQASIIMIYTKNDIPVAGGVVIGDGNCLSNPWASSLREYRSSSPNMLLYWAMLKYAIERGYKQFDFGRSTTGEGTHAFKLQWGAVEKTLYWYKVNRYYSNYTFNKNKDSFDILSTIWKFIPISISQMIGPSIRKNIGL